MAIFDNLKGIIGNNNPSVPPNQTVNPNALKNVLVVEDDQMLGLALETKFRHEGYTVLRALNGQEGLDLITSQKPNIVLLDLMMPVMDGKTMLHRLREIPEFKTLPVVVLTNAGDVENIRQTQMYYGATDFLIKSNVTPDQIVDKVKELI